MLVPRSSNALARAGFMVSSRATAASRNVATFTRSYPPLYTSLPAASPPAFFQQSFHPSLAPSSSAPLRFRRFRRYGAWSGNLAVAMLVGVISAFTFSSADAVKLDASPSSAATSLTSIVADPAKQVVVDSDTNLAFPLYLPTPASFKAVTDKREPRFRLVGLGVRSVSFLRVRVYVAAFYIDEHKLQSHLAQKSSSDSEAKTLEQSVKEMLDDGTSVVIRIVPVRNTDFNHLRDGFIRALQNRLKKAIKQSRLEPHSPLESQFQHAIQQIKDSFPRGSVPKGSPLDLVILPTSSSAKPARAALNFEFDGQIFGEVGASSAPADAKNNNALDAGFTVARELVLAYFADEGEISMPFKKSVQDGLKQLPTSS